MGGTCSDNTGVFERTTTPRYDEDEKARLVDKHHSRDSSFGIPSSNAAAEIAAMSKEVILLSTRNANLTQELDEANRTLTRQRQALQATALNMELMRICKTLGVDFAAVVEKQSDADDKISIVRQVLKLQPSNINMEFFTSLDTNRTLYALLSMFQSKGDERNVCNVMTMLLFSQYYSRMGENADANALSELESICFQLKTATLENVHKIHALVKQNATVQSKYEHDLFE